MWQKGVYNCGYMDDRETVNRTPLPEKKDFYIFLNVEDITDADYSHVKRVCKGFEIKKLGEYHDLYVQSKALLLPNIFENFRNTSLEIYNLDTANFFLAPGLAWQTAF